MRQTWKKQHSRLARSYTPKPTDVRASRLLPGENPLTSLKQSTPSADLPPRIDGKFLAVGSNRFHVKGVAYGTFAPNAHEEQYPPPAQIAHDVRSMVSAGFNTIRTYTAPSAALLDAAAQKNLRLIVGLPWSQHIPFLDSPPLAKQIRREVAAAVRKLANHPSVLMFAVGNEIPAGVVRWHGPHRIECFLRELYADVKDVAPDSLYTYVNFPPTEFLDLEHFDVCAFNVYLHREPELRAYLARLQHLAGSKPLLLAEAGSDSIREGLDGQARLTAMHLRAAFAEGACGAVVYTWTDEWWRGGQPVNDWAFGLVDAARRPKPALAAVTQELRDVPFPAADRQRWPKVSVVICAYNAADTIDDCLASVNALTYPDVDVIVVNDGSCDATGAIARRYTGVRVIDVPNGGLSAARNVGLAASLGEIVAYTDADCRVDADWLTYLVQPILTLTVVGSGGPNVVPPDDPWVAQCVSRAPGGPTHVMLDDRIAEHIPGCNMAFRRDALLSVEGFNPVYLRAGDDVDICWRLQAKGFKIGFSPSALVWHHCRASVATYWRQQVGYGEGETWLDAHHPEKFLRGQMLWHGRIYSPLPSLGNAFGRRINSGVWGTAAFPSVYTAQPHAWQLLPHSSGWMIASLGLLFVGVFGPLAGMDAAWLPLIAGVCGIMTTVFRCAVGGWRSDLSGLPEVGRWPLRKNQTLYRGLIAWLHLIQPVARFRGRLRGLSQPAVVEPQHVTRYPWKMPVPTFRDALASVRLFDRSGSERAFWSESWVSHTALLTELVGVLRASRPAQRVDVDEGWRPDRDLSLAVGGWGWLHVRSLIEEHETGRCLFRVRARLRPSFIGTARGSALAVILAGGTSASMFLYHPSVGAAVLIAAIAAIAAQTAWQATRATALLDRAVVRVATAAGMTPLALAPAVSSPAHGSTKPTVSEPETP